MRLVFALVIAFVAAAMARAQSITVTPSATTYSASGGSITFTVRLEFTQSLSALGVQVRAPVGWVFGEMGGANRPQIVPVAGSTGAFDFAYTNVPGSPAVFTFTASYGAGLSGSQTFSGILAIMRETSGGRTDATAASIVLTGAGGTTTPVAPTIVTQPVGAALSEGLSFSLTVIATGSSPVTYQWRKDGAAIAGATASTYAVTNAAVRDTGSYTVVVTNSVGSATSAAAAIEVRPQSSGPAITKQPEGFVGAVGSAITLRVTATGTGALAYQWRRDGVAVAGGTGEALMLSGAAAESGTYLVTVSNSLGSATSVPVVVRFSTTAVPITIAQQPAGVAIAPGEAGVLRVVATASVALTYQWFKDGAELAGQTASQLSLANASAADAGEYFVEVRAGAERLRSVTVRVSVSGRTSAPAITRQPTATLALSGTAASLNVAASGNPAPTFQWRKNGIAVAGATNATLTLAGVQPADAGGYDVVATNARGEARSSLAQLTVTTTAIAPTIMREPASVAALAGRSVTLQVAATGAPAPTYQWFKDGAAIAGATGSSLALASLAAASGGSYTVTVTNSAGAVTSRGATVRVLARSHAGVYFGSLGAGGNFALQVREDNTGTFVAYAPGARTGYTSANVRVDDNGEFRFAAAALTPGPARAASRTAEEAGGVTMAAAEEAVFAGTISTTGAVSGSGAGAAGQLNGTRSPGGVSSPISGYYQAAAAGGSAQLWAIVGPAGQALVLTLANGVADGALGTVDGAGRVAVSTAATQSILLNIATETGAIAGSTTAVAGGTLVFSGHADSADARAEQRLVNISSRTTAGVGENAAIVGFVIDGLEAKPVLIRAVGPALGALGVAGAIAAPQLELLRDGVRVAVNAGWSSGGAGGDIAAAGARAGAFAFAAASADSAILTTLPPGAYTAVVSAADSRPGIGLVEVYDLAGASREQRLVNISTRASAGSGDATLIAGLVVGGTAPKRVLVRAAGPALAGFGVGGILARPVLRIFSGDTVIAQNAGWTTSADATALVDAAAGVGAFAFPAASADAAIVINLGPGAYTAQVSSADGSSSGIVLLEVYELP